MNKEDWVKKIIRIKAKYFNVCDYLEFLASKKGLDSRQFISEVFKYSLDTITEKGFTYKIEKYEPRRIPKGFTIASSVSEDFDISYDFYKNVYQKKFGTKLYTAEFTELLLYIYCTNNLSNTEIESIEVEWGISKL